MGRGGSLSLNSGTRLVLSAIVLTAWAAAVGAAQLPEELTARAEQGDPAAQNELGSRYYAGRGVEKDEVEALRWVRLSAEQGYGPAQYNLGLMYFRNRGVEGASENDEAAARWYRLAADQGYPPAQAGLAYMYEYGAGIEKDEVAAYMWLELAVAGTTADFSKRLFSAKRDELAERLTADQIAEAERRAAEWKPVGER
ncbi:MAG TPA: hypothetical protein DCP38_14775 [Acidobacteria bacterium]|nr:hypothetical protein [Acidobacteriota bacterium]HAK56729.1 hypothetical protein [Acidobacteriota bacterium]